MLKLHARWLLPPALLTGVLLAVAIGRREHDSAVLAAALNDWDIAQLAAHLKETGLELRMVASQRGTAVGQTAFLTATDMDWKALNDLMRIPEHIDQWRGTLYCNRIQDFEPWSDQIHRWGDCCLLVGPFLFFGDRELLVRVHDALVKR